jgi:ribosomal protein L35AE/L33A
MYYPTNNIMLKKAYILWITLLSPLVQAVPTIQFDLATYEVDEGDGTAIIIVTISEVPSNVITVDYNTSDGTAEERKDYTKESGTLRWDLFDGSNKIITVAIIEDTEIEKPDETFTLTLENPTGDATIGDPDTTEVTIIDNDDTPDPGTLQFSSATYSVNENDGVAEITVSRIDGSNGVVTVKCVSYDGTAEAGKDYTAVSNTLTWTNGEIGDKVCAVGINNDNEEEENEFFSLALEDVTRAKIGDPSVALVTIKDNDSRNPGTLQFSSAAYSVNEDGGSITVTVTRANGSDGAVSVKCASLDKGTATPREDYVPVSKTLNWKDGDDNSKPITIPIFNDDNFEDDETFSLKLSDPGGDAELGSPAATTVTILDDDKQKNPGILQFSEKNYSVFEDGGTVAIPVTRIKGSDGQVSVECLSSDGTATVEEDYFEVSGSLIWEDGDTDEKECSITILDDKIFEGNETFKLKLKNADGGAKIGKPKKAVITIIENEEPECGILQFSKEKYNADEGSDSVKITVDRIDDSSGKAAVKVVSSDGTATKNKDYKKITKNLNWDDGDTKPKSFTVSILDDDKIEGNETFKLKLKKAKCATLGKPKQAEVTIIDDERPGTLQFSGAEYSVNENSGSVKIIVTREGGNSGKASVKAVSSNGSAKNNEDYEKVSEKLNWDNGEDGDKTFTVTILDDNEFENSETFSLALEKQIGAVIGDPDNAEVTIIDNDQIAGTLQFSEKTYSVNESDGSIDVIVTRIGGKDGAVSVNCVSSNGSAKAGKDYKSVMKTLNWHDQDDEDKICTVTIINDTEYEKDEFFNLTLDNATGGIEIGEPDNAKIDIVDDDQKAGTLQFSKAKYSVDESDDFIEVTVTRTGGKDGVVTVKCASSDDSATAGSDYTTVTETLSWDDQDDKDKTCIVNILDDTDIEDDETFNLMLKNETGGTKIGNPGTTVVTIIDDDQHGTLQFSEAEHSVDEDDGSIKVTVTRTGGKDGAVIVDCISSDGDAKAGNDYAAVTKTLSWDDQDDEDKTCTVDILDDDVIEDNESFNLTLENETGGAEIGTRSTEIIIMDDDDAGTLQFSKAKYSVDENKGKVKIIVTRINGKKGTVSVNIASSDDTATAGDDYIKTSYKLEWGDGIDGKKEHVVSILDDSDIEDNETFKMKLSNPIGNATIGEPNEATVTIIDDDMPLAGALQFSKTEYSINEDGGSIKITITRKGGDKGAVSVDLSTANGSAVAGKDYIGISGITFNWSDGDESDKHINITILEDNIIEGNETFELNLSNPKGGAAIGNPSTAKVTIIDNDEPPAGALQFSKAKYSVNEDGGTVKIIVTRKDGDEGAVSVELSTADDSAEAGKDYIGITSPIRLNWNDGDDSDKDIYISILDDNDIEGDETFDLILSNPTGGATIGDQGTAVVTVIDNDIPPAGVLQFSKAEYSVNENGSSVKITITREYSSLGAVSVDLSTADGSAVAGKDYVGINEPITFSWDDGDDSDKILSISIIDDYEEEGDETFSLTLSNPTGGAAIGDPGTGVVIIIDNEVPAGTLQFSKAEYSVNEEDGSVKITITRENGSLGAASVDLSTADGSADSDDYVGTDKPITLSWDDGDDSDRILSISIIDDDEEEGTETFNLTLSNPTGATIGDPATAKVKIIDICDGIEEIPSTECNALIALYLDAGGNDWDNNTNWIITDTPCSWHGVTCSDGHVTRLYLYNNNLDGEMPSDLGDLNELERLLLFDNKLSGEIPPELGDLNQLEYLWLQENELCGDIPEALMDTAIPANVGYLKLDDNHLITDVSDDLEEWLDLRNPTWDGSQTDCPVSIALQFSQSTYSVNENEGTVIITVTRTGSSEGEVSVVCATSDDSAIAGDDYNELFEVLSWADGDSQDKVCQIDIFDDSDLEGDETFIVSLGYPDGAELESLNAVTVTIIQYMD